MGQERIQSSEKPIACTCPRCGKKHVKCKFYTGNTPPMYFCKMCKKIASEYDNEEPLSVGIKAAKVLGLKGL